ncbi:MAG: arginine--tRNA ligase [Acidobacteria bacterium]|nr:arginine--tRNA ligase [Acidobacteriota bacterium]MBV9474478.1 arginine--tRNA ligase [Acidobacteriota bacterium]
MILEEIHARLTETLQSRVLALFGQAVDRIVLQAPPKLNMGDLATPVALELAKALKRKPREIAQQLADGMTLPLLVASVSVEGAGYLNFRLDRGAFTAAHLQSVMEPPAPSGTRVIVEHTNINPNKAAHIGHLRNSVLGDTYVRCAKWLGDRVETQNYIDDTGVQVADVVVAFEKLEQKTLADVEALIANPGDESFDYVCWNVYSQMAQHYAANPDALQWRRETLHRIEEGGNETAAMAATIARAIVHRHLKTMQRLDITYDLLPKESDIIALHFWDRAFELLKQSGAVVLEAEGKHAGCWVMKLDEAEEFAGMNEPDKILVRSNGTVTYTGKDIAYQLWKLGRLDRTFDYREFARAGEHIVWETTHDGTTDPRAPKFGGASRVVNVIDSRQSYLQKVVKEGVRQVAGEAAAEASIHFAYEMVALTPSTAKALGMELSEEDASRTYVEMSGRKGLGVKADDLLNWLQFNASEAVRNSLAKRAEPGEFKDGEDHAIAERVGKQVAIGALRYFMLRFGRNKVIAFDWEEALRFEGDSGPYLQYSTVRVQNIFAKMRKEGIDPRIDDRAVDDLTLNQGFTDDMWELVRLSAELPAAIRRAVDSLELSIVTQYLLELAQKFNSFYHKYPIRNEKDAAERQRRAVCAEVFRRTMVGALELLGIPVPERM